MVTVYKTHQQLEDEDTERYLKKQADILERRKARILAEGYKCTVEGCGQSFKEIFLLRSHVNDHNEECRKAMKCNQAKCGGLNFNNRRDYNDHVDMHKEEARLKIINSIRSVLLYNKHGLLMETFEREFRGMTGKQVPFKLLGFNSSYDLVTNLPDVVQVTPLAGGQTLLLAVPDKATEHIAKMVGNQRTNREGFNYRTGEVLATVSRDVIRKIEKAVDGKTRVVPEFMKRQVGQLIQLDMFEGGLNLLDFGEVYDQEFGYPLDFQCYGFYSLEDFIFYGLEGVVGIELDGVSWKIVPTGYKRSGEAPQVQEVPLDVKNNIKKLLDENPFGLSVATFIKTYEECFGKLNLRQLRCKDVVELCLLIPNVSDVDKSDCDDLTILPAGHQIENEKSVSPLWVLGEVKNNIWKMLQSLSFGVSLPAFVKGYEGYYGHLNLDQLQCADMMDLCRLMPDVCDVKMEENGQYLVRPVKKLEYEDKEIMNIEDVQVSEASVPSSQMMNIKRVLVKNPGGVTLSRFEYKYLETVGENLNDKRLGFSSLKSLLSSLDGSFLKFNSSEKYPNIKLAVVSEEESVLGPDPVLPLAVECLVQAGWVRVMKVVSPDLIYLQMEGMMDKVRNLEDKMEHFYTNEMAGHKINPEKIVVGLTVAALHRDMAWHRGRVLAIKEERGVAEVFFVDLGVSALVKMLTLRCLDSQFRDLPMQAVSVELSGLECLDGVKYWSSEVIEELKDIVARGKGRGWVQKRKDKGENNFVDLFMKLLQRNDFNWGPGQITLINQALVEKGIVKFETDHSVGVLDKSMMWMGVPVSGKHDGTLQRLLLASLLRIRVDDS